MLGSSSRNLMDLVSLETNGLLTFIERNISLDVSCGEYGCISTGLRPHASNYTKFALLPGRPRKASENDVKAATRMRKLISSQNYRPLCLPSSIESSLMSN